MPKIDNHHPHFLTLTARFYTFRAKSPVDCVLDREQTHIGVRSYIQNQRYFMSFGAMSQITSLFAHKVVNVATASGPGRIARRRSLLKSVGIDPEAPVDPKVRISDSDYYALCERVGREDGNGVTVPLRVGASMRCDDYGAFGLAFKSAINLRKSYERAERYGLVLTSVSAYEIRAEGDRHYMMLHREGERRLGLRLSNEQTIVAITQISREVSREQFIPEKVLFKHQSPDDLAAHEEYFGCPVVFGADRDALQLSEQTLNVPNKLADKAISEFFDSHLENELPEFAGNLSLARRLRSSIAQSLSEGVPTISEIAGRFNMSARTLQRRLSDDGLTFQQVVDESRRELAERFLRKTAYSLSEIAFLTGFADRSAFNRAFKRWAEKTPRSYRLEVKP